jgi:hypothetical protein
LLSIFAFVTKIQINLKKDLEIPKVTDIGIAIVKSNEYGDDEYYAHIINFKSIPITNILINTRGYGMIDNHQKKTSSFTHFIEELPAKSSKVIEPISPEVFGINNEFFVTFYIAKTIYDKKYIFLAESIQSANFIKISILEQEGVLIK